MIEIAELRRAARVSGTSRDAQLVDYERAAVAHVEQETGRYFGDEEGVTETIPGTGTVDLWLPEKCKEIPATVSEHATPGDTPTTVTASASDGYVLRGDATLSKLTRKGGSVWSPWREYAVTYTRGYETGEEPSDIRQAVKGLVVYWDARRIPLPRVGETHTFPIPHHVEKIVANWRRLHV